MKKTKSKSKSAPKVFKRLAPKPAKAPTAPKKPLHEPKVVKATLPRLQRVKTPKLKQTAEPAPQEQPEPKSEDQAKIPDPPNAPREVLQHIPAQGNNIASVHDRAHADTSDPNTQPPVEKTFVSPPDS